MANLATATLVVQYLSGDSQSNIKAEFDPEEHPSSNFQPGTNVFFRIFANCNFEVIVAGGTPTSVGTGDADIEDEMVQFVQTKVANLGYPYQSNWNFTMLAKHASTTPNPNTPSVGSSEVTLTTTLRDDQILAIGKASYRSRYAKWRANPSESTDGHAMLILVRETI